MPRIRATLALLAALCAAGCGQGESNVVSGNREGVLHYGLGVGPQALDPHVMTSSSDSDIARALFEGLVTFNPETLAIEPGTASSWDISEDGRTYTFHLNPAARWSNGEALTAQDWEWSFMRSLHPAMGNQNAYVLYPVIGAEEFARGDNPDFSAVGIRALDSHTLRIELENPTPYFLQELANHPNYPVHRATVEAQGEFTARYSGWTRPENFVGNGPFKLDSWPIGRAVEVSKNPWYWDADKVALNGIVFHTLENLLSTEKMFRVGQLHYTRRVPLSRIPWYREQKPSPYLQAPQLGTYFFMFNTERAPVDDPRVRQALAMSLDREGLVDKLLLGTGVPSPGLIPRDLIPGYQPPDLLDYDPERARALLAEAGYPDGEGLPKLELLYNTSENHRKIVVAMQQMWKDELNIHVELVNQEWKVFLDTTDNRDYQIARMGWQSGIIDVTFFLSAFTSENGFNRTGFSNRRYDEILQELAPATLDPVARSALLQEAETLLINETPIIPLYTYTSQHLIQPSVNGLPSNLLDIPNFKYTRLTPDAPAWGAQE